MVSLVRIKQVLLAYKIVYRMAKVMDLQPACAYFSTIIISVKVVN